MGLVGRRVRKIERLRASLVERDLLPNEQLLENTPAEAPTTPLATPGIQDSRPVILFASDRRLLWVSYDGSGSYRPVPLDPYGQVRSAPYGAFRTLFGFPSADRGGFGFLILSDEDLSQLGEMTRSSVTTLDLFQIWADATLGQGAGLVLAPILSDHPDARHLQMFLFPMWTRLTEAFIDLVNRRNARHLPAAEQPSTEPRSPAARRRKRFTVYRCPRCRNEVTRTPLGRCPDCNMFLDDFFGIT